MDPEEKACIRRAMCLTGYHEGQVMITGGNTNEPKVTESELLTFALLVYLLLS